MNRLSTETTKTCNTEELDSQNWYGNGIIRITYSSCIQYGSQKTGLRIKLIQNVGSYSKLVANYSKERSVVHVFDTYKWYDIASQFTFKLSSSRKIILTYS